MIILNQLNNKLSITIGGVKSFHPFTFDTFENNVRIKSDGFSNVLDFIYSDFVDGDDDNTPFESLTDLVNLLSEYCESQPNIDEISQNLDAFNRLRISSPQTIFDSKQIYDNQPLFWDDQQVSGSGTSSVYNTNRASSTLSVSNLTAGRRVRRTKRRFNYQPGKSLLVKKTFKLETKKTGIKIRDGYFDDRNGVYFYTHADSYGIGVRTSTSGSPFDNLITQTDWNIDKFDGTGPSGLTLSDYKKLLFFFDMEWLGVGIIATGFFFNRKPYYCHFYDTGKSDDLVTMSIPNLPCSTEIENDGTGVAASTTCICATVISEGGLNDTGFPFGLDRDAALFTTGNNTSIYPVLGLRLKSGYLSSSIKLLDISVTCTSSASYNFMLLLNPTIVGTALVWTDIPNSSCQQMNTSTSATTVTGGTKIYTKAAQQGNSGGSDVGSLTTDFNLGSTIAGVSDIVLLCIRRTSGTTETFDAAINFKDQQ
jgi:hypothetical protein